MGKVKRVVYGIISTSAHTAPIITPAVVMRGEMNNDNSFLNSLNKGLEAGNNVAKWVDLGDKAVGLAKEYSYYKKYGDLPPRKPED